MDYLIFFLLAAAAIFGALNVVLRKNPVIGVLNLVLTILSLAGLFITLHAEFLAAVQIIVYAGAIMVLFLFVVLLMNLDREMWEDFSIFRLPTPIVGSVFGIALVLMAWNAEVPQGEGALTDTPGSGTEVGRLLFTEYAFPFEIVSVILLAGMIGAIILAKKRRVE